MFEIVDKEPLNATVTKMVVKAPLIARKAQPGQFIIFRALPDSCLLYTASPKRSALK